MMMAAIGGGLLFGQAKGFYIAGAVVLAILAALATLEGGLNFCMGCWMFGMAQRFRTHRIRSTIAHTTALTCLYSSATSAHTFH